MSRIALFAIPLALVLGSTSLAIAQTTPQATDQVAPIAGANSFTENQAKDRIEKAGYRGDGSPQGRPRYLARQCKAG